MKNSGTVSTFEKELLDKNIFIITQDESENKNIILNEFGRSESFIKYLVKKKINVITDEEVELPFLKKIKSLIYDLVSTSMGNSGDSDIFWYRLSGAFVFSVFLFLFFTYIIPDPIPYVDELAISSLGGVLFYLLIVKLNLFAFISSKTIEKYTEYIDSIKVIYNKDLKKLNEIFKKFQNKIRNNEYNVDKDLEHLKKEIDDLNSDAIIIIKDLFNIMNKTYSLNKLDPNKKRFIKEMKKSPFSEKRFYFYFLLNKLIFM